MIRSLQVEDYEGIKRIHEKYYAEEFSLPNFADKFLCSFAVITDGDIVCAGGIRSIVESIIVTDKSKSTRVRHESLMQMLDAQAFMAGKYGYTELHASIINDPMWKQHLEKVGFNPIKGEMLVLNL